ncbi:MAG: AraC family transcriptional regulator [Vicinamibacterales bacterium]
MSADVLSDVLQAVRLTGAVYFDFELTSPWVAEAPPSSEIAAAVMPGAERVIEYHVIARGACWAQAIGGTPIRLQEGDVVMFPQGDPHVLSSAPGMRATPNLQMYARGSTPLPLFFEAGGGGAQGVRLICCFFGCDERPFNPLLESLPASLHVPAPAASGSGGWTTALLQAAVTESRHARPGSQNVLARLSELMFVETVRRHLESLPAGRTGWLAGLRDPLVGQALTALHAAPAEHWTVERLAREVGASRSVLAERFTALVGHPPMQYLTQWRMQVASRALIEGRSVAAAAAVAGYDSEPAFSRAFKKVLGQAPGSWRRSSAR